MLSRLMMLAVVLWPGVVWAEVTAPPEVSNRNGPPILLGYGIMFILLVVVMVVSLIPSKRGHQD